MKERNGYYWDVIAWRNSRRVKAMDHLTRAIYREVMDEIWVNGPLPNDASVVANVIGWPLEDVTRSWPAIHSCLEPTKKNPELFTSERLEIERRKQKIWLRQKVEAGRSGGLRSAEARKLKAAQGSDNEHDTNEPPLKQLQATASATLAGRSSEINHNISSSSNGQSGVVVTLPLNTGPEFKITTKHVEEWTALYPAVDVPQECRAMRGWLISNPRERKTLGGIMRFCNGWLSRAQNKPKAKAATNNPTGVHL